MTVGIRNPSVDATLIIAVSVSIVVTSAGMMVVTGFDVDLIINARGMVRLTVNEVTVLVDVHPNFVAQIYLVRVEAAQLEV